jgi:ESS family glutamate:Na+ symporter
MVQTLSLGAIMYYCGVFIRNKIPIFTKLSIPASALGGLIIAVLLSFLQYIDLAIIRFDPTLENLLMLTFFATVGMNASYKLLLNGGLLIIAFWGICSFTILVQNFLGISIAKLFGMNSLMGIICGSVSMMGGLATAGSYGKSFALDFGVTEAIPAGFACATFGMIIGSALGGLLAEWIIKIRKIKTPYAETIKKNKSDTGDQSSDYEEIGVLAQEEGVVAVDSEEEDVISGPHLMKNLAWILVALGCGTVLSHYFSTIKIGRWVAIFPSYLYTMIIAVIVRNIGDSTELFKIDTKAVGMISDISLAIFVTTAIMSLHLGHIMNLALPILIILSSQIILILIISYFMVFWLLGKDYDSTVMSAGLVGFGLGATPNALANMKTVTSKHGVAIKALFVVPIVSAFLVDLTNAMLISILANIFN